jgi:hypothetical protein
MWNKFWSGKPRRFMAVKNGNYAWKRLSNFLNQGLA